MWNVLWRVWKWLVHLVTGKSELQRLAESSLAVGLKTWSIENSLRKSHVPALRSVVVSSSLEVDEAVTIIAKEKLISLHTHSLAVRELWVDVDRLRAEAYSQENKDHERMLLELWAELMPGTALKARVTKQWQELGFQGDNPATDFRGMGVLSLHCLRHLAGSHLDQARAMLSHSHHPQHGYPLAVVAINMTGLLYSLLEEGALNWHLYCTAPHWPLTLSTFQELFCYVFHWFDQFWLDRRPANVMAFPALREEFSAALRLRLSTSHAPQPMALAAAH